MVKTSVVYARIDAQLKEEAEAVLKELGTSPKTAIAMYYSRIIHCKGLPFDLKLCTPLSEEKLGRETVQKGLNEAFEDCKEGRTYTSEEIKKIMKIRYEIDI